MSISSHPPLPLPLFGSCVATYENALYVFGGRDRRTNQNSHLMFSYVPSRNNWSVVTSGASKCAPQATFQCSMVAAMNHLFIYGGIFESGEISNGLHAYSLDSHCWFSVCVSGNVPKPSFGASIFISPNFKASEGQSCEIYIYGGTQSHSAGAASRGDRSFSASLYALHLTRNELQAKASDAAEALYAGDLKWEKELESISQNDRLFSESQPSKARSVNELDDEDELALALALSMGRDGTNETLSPKDHLPSNTTATIARFECSCFHSLLNSEKRKDFAVGCVLHVCGCTTGRLPPSSEKWLWRDLSGAGYLFATFLFILT